MGNVSTAYAVVGVTTVFIGHDRAMILTKRIGPPAIFDNLGWPAVERDAPAHGRTLDGPREI